MVQDCLKNFSNFIDTGIIHDDVHVVQFKVFQYGRHLACKQQNVTERCTMGKTGYFGNKFALF